MLFEYLPRKNTLRCAVGQVKPVPLQEEATCSATRAISRRCARSRQVKGVLRTLKHGQNRTSCVFDKRYAEQQCRRNSRQRRKFAPPGASQKKGAISEFPTKGYPPNPRVVVETLVRIRIRAGNIQCTRRIGYDPRSTANAHFFQINA